MSGLSHTAPDAVLPILAPDAVVSSAVVSPNSSTAVGAAAKLDAVDDVAPLIGAAHLQAAAVAAVELDEVVGLQHHVVELDEGERLLALEPQLHRIVGEHAVDAEMASVVAQEIDVVELVEPIGIVDHERVARRSSPKLTNLPNTDSMPAILAAISASVEQLARLVLAGRIADLGGAAADQHDRLVPGLLQLAQHHDPEQIADMQARRGAVEADIAGDAPRFCAARRGPPRRSLGEHSRGL